VASEQPEAMVPVEFRASADRGKDQGGTKDGAWDELNPNDRELCCVSFQTTNVQVAGRILNDLSA